MYCFLKDKTVDIYSLLFLRIDLYFAVNGLVFKPNKVIMDFEAASYKAIQSYCSRENISGCYFHYDKLSGVKFLN